MKKVIICILVLAFFSCGNNPNISPETSKALSEIDQTKEIREQTVILKEQSLQLKRIADAIEKINNKEVLKKEVSSNRVVNAEKVNEINIGQ